MWERTCEKCGGLLRGYGDGGREGNGERERGVWVWVFRGWMGLIRGIDCTSKWILDEDGDMHMKGGEWM